MPETKGLGIIRVHLGAVKVRGGDLDGARYQWLEDGAERFHARHGERTHGCAVISGVTADDLVTTRLPTHRVPLTGQLQRGLDGFAATRGEKDAVEIARGELRQFLRQVDRCRVGVGPQREVSQFTHLGGGDFRDVRAAVTQVTVDVLLAIGIPHVGLLATNEDRNFGRLRISAHAREVQPQMSARTLRIVVTRAGRIGNDHAVSDDFVQTHFVPHVYVCLANLR